MHKPSRLTLLVFCCFGITNGFRAAHPALSVQQQSARCVSPQLCTTPPARRGLHRVAGARPWLAAFVVSSVVAMPTLALASATAAGEHLHLGQKIALFFKRVLPAALLPSPRSRPSRALCVDAAGTGLPDWAVLLLISMTPAVELRGGVPVHRPNPSPNPSPDNLQALAATATQRADEFTPQGLSQVCVIG